MLDQTVRERQSCCSSVPPGPNSTKAEMYPQQAHTHSAYIYITYMYIYTYIHVCHTDYGQAHGVLTGTQTIPRGSSCSYNSRLEAYKWEDVFIDMYKLDLSSSSVRHLVCPVAGPWFPVSPVAGPWTYEPLRVQPHSSCWPRLIHKCTFSHLFLPISLKSLLCQPLIPPLNIP